MPNELPIERDLRLRNEQDNRTMSDRIGRMEIWQASHEATCLGRYQALINGQRLITLGVGAAVALAIPQAWPHLLTMLGWGH